MIPINEPIPPLILISFLENAFKHGVSNSFSGYVTIYAKEKKIVTLQTLKSLEVQLSVH
jgi:sensor histidine kinase YesM